MEAAPAQTGAVVLTAADPAARTLLPPLEIPVGALTTPAGGPYLLWLPGRTVPCLLWLAGRP
ncbi:iron chelate uptake ABC transporter family permease subunit [Streptomyces camelliae]|uniref:Iron chelate uptake ABC transporter family permease subunit n=1 Tax=Streptomyces camelliae TaxID=3004093 RepID=A0ABY7PK93_9ACTN|nr:iron chelate uptake ABC transporter family permease subunit [Streptomyces sp. HUAS 2-6]WBO69228.1 iron chelate uptake ABC transporter family permease subunit [Streptomyces sp. HUAS 2-6]